MDLGIAGRTALVLGGGGGLGSAIAVELAAEGAKVAIADVDESALATTIADLRRRGEDAISIQWDLGDLDSMDGHIRRVESELGPVAILVNNTGGPPPSPVTGQPLDSWRHHIEHMVLSVIAITDRVLPQMRAQQWGRIITSASSGVLSPIPNLGLSNALRSTLVGWSKTLAAETAAEGITANIVVPGRIATQRIDFLDEQKSAREQRTVDEIRALSVATIPAGRYGRPEEYAKTVAFIASEAASYITGSIIRVDGGFISAV